MNRSSRIGIVLTCLLSSWGAGHGNAMDSITVRVVGTLETGIVAIGGESTGTTITANGICWELAVDEPKVRKLCDRLNGKKVVVEGTLGSRAGIETGKRWIVTVTHLHALASQGVQVKQNAKLQAVTGRQDTKVVFNATPRETIIDIRSGFGIDHATIARVGSTWPESLLVRLQLKGLELFRVENNRVAVEWSVSSSTPRRRRVTLCVDGKETAIDKQSPFFSELQIVAERGSHPVKDDYFEVRLPVKLYADNPQELELRWIDFYRN
ncbi:MAG: hypothetical protein P8N76_16825 [Pirellulaceae bacterium]|nr:hypothetical protein [Pirellulaceae bacterium]